MGCDYYIVKYLCIYFNDKDNDNDNDVLNFEIDRERAYFSNFHLGDEDEDDYEKKGMSI